MKIKAGEWNKLSAQERHKKLVQARALNIWKWQLIA